jgi:hypothetical protein
VVRISRSKSRRPTDFLPSITESEHRQIEPAVMDSEIERLPDLAGFLKLASSPDWLRVTLRLPKHARETAATPGPSCTAEALRRHAAGSYEASKAQVDTTAYQDAWEHD